MNRIIKIAACIAGAFVCWHVGGLALVSGRYFPALVFGAAGVACLVGAILAETRSYTDDDAES